jgi:hypothetical protein
MFLKTTPVTDRNELLISATSLLPFSSSHVHVSMLYFYLVYLILCIALQMYLWIHISFS